MSCDSKGPLWYQVSNKILKVNNEFSPKKVSLQITGIYIGIGILWFLLSDEIVSYISHDIRTLKWLIMLKGWFYVLITGMIVFVLIYSALKKVQSIGKELLNSYDELSVAYKEITSSEEELRRQLEVTLQYQERLQFLGCHDVLTGLPNRAALYENAEKQLREAGDNNTAYMFIDIDNFKLINDNLGHVCGDQLIKKVSEKLVTILKTNCSLYRLGGDEFLIVMRKIHSKLDLEVYATHIIACFKEPFKVQDSSLHITISMGISIYPEDGISVDQLLKCADIAMYRAKEAGRNTFAIYVPAMNEVVMERVNIEKYLHNCIGRNELELYYQPQLDIKANKISGFEALLRSCSPELGHIPIIRLIKVAEDTQLIIPLGAWVLKNACSFLKRVHRMGYTEIKVAVNISMIQLLQSDFADMVVDTLAFYEIDPQYLELEITESVLMESYDIISEKLNILRMKGFGISLDDFGTGYSSLNYLSQLPITTYKIDKSFIDNICCDQESATLAEQIIAIGKSMNLCVIAEGVETKEQFEFLKEKNCDKIQGYYFRKPLPESEAILLIQKEIPMTSTEVQ